MTAGYFVTWTIAGVLQRSAWKARHLECCRAWRSHVGERSPSAWAAWRHGLRLGVHCGCSCAGLMTVGLVLGVMNVTVMSIVAVVVTAERLATSGARIARISGSVAMGVGVLLVVRALAAV
jgi:predicted metal-binding membrane protein